MKEHAEGATLNQEAVNNAKKMIQEGRVIVDEYGDWHEREPTNVDEDQFIKENGFKEYGKWFLGVDDNFPENTKEHYKFLCGDFVNVYRSACIAVEELAGQFKYSDIEVAARNLKTMMAGMENMGMRKGKKAV